MTTQQSCLLEQKDMSNLELVPDWLPHAYRVFRQTVLDPTFPCYFGMGAERKGELRYSFLPHDDWGRFPESVKAFLQLMRQPPFVRRGLFVFVEPEKKPPSIDYYRAYFWQILQYLHECDEKEWPHHIPKDPDHYLWSFSFDGEPMFAFFNAPAYKQRLTRNLGPSMVIGMQPRVIFEGLEGETREGSMSREKVRERVEAWDHLPKHPDISHYGDPGHREWKQYVIGDDVKPIQGKCPIHFNQE